MNRRLRGRRQGRAPESVFIQAMPDGLREFARRERLGEKINALFQWKILAGDFGAVAAGVIHFQFWLFLQKPSAQLHSGHPARHYEIGEQQFDFIAVLLPDFEGFNAAGCLEHAVAQLRQDLARGLAQGRFVFNEQDRFIPAAHGGQFGWLRCGVPINSAQPLEWARQLARRELAVEQFGPCTPTDADHLAGKYNPKDGISETGRLVVLQMPAG